MKRQTIQTLMALFCAIFLSNLVNGQIIKAELAKDAIPGQNDLTFFSSEQLNKKWEEFSSNKNFAVLQKEVGAKKFSRILNKEASWGFTGTITNDNGGKDSVLLCIYDFLNPANIKQGCSMLWARVGNKSYKAYLVFPEGSTKDVFQKFHDSEEWFVDEKTSTVQKAHSWGHTFGQCVERGVSVPGVETELSNNRSKINIGKGTVTVSCPGICFGAALGCTTLASGVAIALAGTAAATAASGGVSVGALVAAGGIGAAMLLLCVGSSCGACTLLCALAAL